MDKRKIKARLAQGRKKNWLEVENTVVLGNVSGCPRVLSPLQSLRFRRAALANCWGLNEERAVDQFVPDAALATADRHSASRWVTTEAGMQSKPSGLIAPGSRIDCQIFKLSS